MTEAELAELPPAQDPLTAIVSGPVPWRRLVPMMVTYFCMGWTGWLYVTWMPSMFSKNYGLDLKKSSALYALTFLCAMLAEFISGTLSDYPLQRTGSKQIARARRIAICMLLALASLVSAILVHDVVFGILSLTLALFFWTQQSHQFGLPPRISLWNMPEAQAH